MTDRVDSRITSEVEAKLRKIASFLKLSKEELIVFALRRYQLDSVTITFGALPSFVKRLVAEYLELSDRIDKLQIFLFDNDSLAYPVPPAETYDQLSAMLTYSDALLQRLLSALESAGATLSKRKV